MKILITGATGLIGSEIVRICHDRNIEVNYLTTRPSMVKSEKGYKGFLWNPKREEIDCACFDGVTAIINLAGANIAKRWTPNYKKQILNSRINALKTLYKGLKKVNTSKISSFVSASAIGIYPNSLSNFYYEDETDVDKSFLGKVVNSWEEELVPLKTFDFQQAKVRIGLVISNSGGALHKMKKPINAYAGAAFGRGNQWHSWIHITDLAEIFLHITENQLSGIYNGVAPNPVTNATLINEIGFVLNKPIFLPNIPTFVMKLTLGEMSYMLLASQKVSCEKIKNTGYEFKFKNISYALKE